MPPLAILPVIDLMDGQVVRGVAGRRSEYRPIQSLIANSAAPGDVARAFVKRFGFQKVYVADLDAIGGRQPNWDAYESIAETGLSIWLDGSLDELTAGGRLVEGIERLIVGLETLPNPDLLADLVDVCGRNGVAFSLDLKAGQPLTSSPAWQGMSPEQIATTAIECGIGTMILLDLAQVGMYGGVGTEDLCRRVRARYPQLRLIGGGGVRSLTDLQNLAAAGFNMALVASALHDGRITPEDLRNA